MIDTSLTRRTLLVSGLVTGALTATVGVARPADSAGRDPRLVVIHLSGGLDGLAAVPPIGDRSYEAVAGTLRPTTEDALPLDGFFGLHPVLSFLHSRYRAGEALVWHAAATPYRGGSHAEASGVLEAGLARPGSDGWLSRAAATMAVTRGRFPALLAVSARMPLVMRGPAPASLCSAGALGLMSPQRLAETLSSSTRQGAPSCIVAAGGSTAPTQPPFRDTMLRLGQVLAEPVGSRMATIALGGWDTHADQARCLSAQLAVLDGGLAGLREGAGAAWRETAVLVVGEFGRAVPANGSGGTDHGLAGAGFLLGGAVAGGCVICDWPGLAPSDLDEGRSLRPTRDVRDLFAALLCDHMGLPHDLVAANVFPDGPFRPVGPLIRANLA